MEQPSLEGVIDLHVHAAPDVRPRCVTDLALAWEAAGRGMRGFLLKSHYGETAGRAAIVREAVPGIEAFGSLVLNDSVGGLNPTAVDYALTIGAKEVWLPTISADHHHLYHGSAAPGIRVTDETGAVLPEVRDILRLIADADAILGTGHVSLEEIAAVVPAALDAGVRKILVTHPEWPPTRLTIEQQRALLASGKVFFERCYVSAKPPPGHVPFQTIVEAIEALGTSSTVVSTDFGRADLPHPVQGMAEYLQQLARHGFSEDDIDIMARRNPAYLLGLDEPPEAA
jgi:hypothetical protein